jgi:hypothetical protein
VEKLHVLMCGFKKRFDCSLRKSKVFEMGLCDGKNQLLQFRDERFMPEAFENPEGLFFGNDDILCQGLSEPLLPVFSQEF